MNKPRLTFSLSAIVACTALILSWVGYVQCQFIKFESDISTGGTIAIQFGIWYHQNMSVVKEDDGDVFIYTACSSYPDSVDIDASWKAARAFAVMGLIVGTIFFIINIVAACYPPDDSKVIVGPGLVLSSLFTGLSLLFLQSNACNNNMMVQELSDPSSPVKDIPFPESCSISTGAKCIISATLLYFVASVMSCSARAEEKMADEDDNTSGQLSSLTEPFLVSQKSIFLRR